MLSEEIKSFIKGETADDEATLKKYSRDASIFEIKPEIIVCPKNTEDLKKLVGFVSERKNSNQNLSITARSGGTDMSGGPLNDSIIADFSRHFNQIKEIGDGWAVAEPGVFYRDFEKAALAQNYILPSYPASREICTLGGMVMNNAAGEKTLKYGKTLNYVENVKMVLADGEEHGFGPIDSQTLTTFENQPNLEGQIYKKIHNLLEENYDLIKKARPDVSKNSAGFNLWDVWDRKVFNLAKLIVGSQGVLGLLTEIKFRLVKKTKAEGLVVIFLKDLKNLGPIIQEILKFSPVSLESFDHYTLKLALRFFPAFGKLLGAKNIVNLGFQFLPEVWLVLTKGMPQLILLAEFEEENEATVLQKKKGLLEKISSFPEIEARNIQTQAGFKKYWAVRRESFNLLRHKIKNKQAAPFVDDVIVRPEKLPEFLPKLYEILDRYELLYTIAGHAGDGNFHIIPLMNLSKEEERAKIPKIMDEVYDLVFRFGGSTSGEHNDGLIRAPYLEKMYGREIYQLFEKVKNIFDPQGIFNPRKKIGVTMDYLCVRIKKP